MSQDHLETWFSSFRAGLGANDNASETDFPRLYRKLLVCHEFVYDRNRSNCISNDTGVLTVSSQFIPPKIQAKPRSISIELNDFDYKDTINAKLIPYEEHMNAQKASEVETIIKEKIKRMTKSSCQMCFGVFRENEKENDS